MKLTNHLDRAMGKISENQIISAIRRGLLHIMPLIMVGSFTLMILNLPIPAFQDFMGSIFGEYWRTLGLAIYNGTFEIMSLAAVMSISYAYYSRMDVVMSGVLNPLSVIIASLCSYFTFHYVGDVLIETNSANSRGMLAAIVISIVSTRIYVLLFKNIRGKINVYTYDADSLLRYSLKNILPLLITLIFFGLVRVLFNILNMNLVAEGIMESINNAFQSSNGGLISTILFIVIIQVLWFFGMHGTNILDTVARNIFLAASDINIANVEAGEAPTQIFTKEFFDAFVFIGGAGCTLGLLIALLIAGKSSNSNRVARYSILPGLFNINETMTYGLPIIFNPYYLIPFMLGPIITCIVSYLGFFSGLVPLTIQRVEWTTPIFLSGYVSTGSIAGIILQAVNLALSVLIYFPFVRLYEKQVMRNNIKIYQSLAEKVVTDDASKDPEKVLGRSDYLGVLARSLISEIEQEIANEKNRTLHLKYQPKVTADGKVFGAEALLRWEHPVYGYVSPLVILNLCDEAGLTNHLGTWIMNTALKQLEEWHKAGYEDISLSVNLTPKQLKEDVHLLQTIDSCLKKTKVSPSKVELELTEHAAVDQSFATRQRLEQIKQTGINLSIDDFGMGNSSLLYIRDFFVNVVKIDISLVRSINDNLQSQEIVRSIVSLCSQLGIEMVAEGVETKEQMEKLQELGCHQYQGFYYSKALSNDDFIQYVKSVGIAKKK